jgi:hypothetical protein
LERRGYLWHQMNDSLVEVFLGDPIGDRGELHALNRLRGDLHDRGVSARVFANFVAAGSQQRQIDLLVATPTRLVHAELKAVTPKLPLVGGANGPWQQLLLDGRHRQLEPNPYRQAHQGTYAISDVMRKLARQGEIPEAVAFYKHIDTVVCLYPSVPSGSRFASYQHVDVVDYEGLLARLLDAGPCPPWKDSHWEAFARTLGVYRQVEESAGEQSGRADAAAVADYRR